MVQMETLKLIFIKETQRVHYSIRHLHIYMTNQELKYLLFQNQQNQFIQKLSSNFQPC